MRCTRPPIQANTRQRYASAVMNANINHCHQGVTSMASRLTALQEYSTGIAKHWQSSASLAAQAKQSITGSTGIGSQHNYIRDQKRSKALANRHWAEVQSSPSLSGLMPLL